MNYLETRCENLKKDYNELNSFKGEQLEQKLKDKILELNNDVDKKVKSMFNQTKESQTLQRKLNENIKKSKELEDQIKTFNS